VPKEWFFLRTSESKQGYARASDIGTPSYFWKIPCGFVKEARVIPASAMRELEEGTGLWCDLPKIKSRGLSRTR
jgi:ADP-ribose pyrophosphatase YjhB (NUDIX family)